MESEEADIMGRPPRKLEDPLFGRPMIISGLIQGLSILAIDVAVYACLLLGGYGEGEARMIAFVCLVFADLGLILSNRSRTRSIISTLGMRNPALWWVVGGATGLLSIVLASPFLRQLFKFAPLHRWEVLLIAGAGLLSILAGESIKVSTLRRAIIGEPQLPPGQPKSS
jgi:Ca2+-transporting ATPase